jgi:hypothetical protein
MNYLSSALYIFGPLAFCVMLVLFAVMGKRMGQALELPPYYRLYYVSIIFLLLPLPIVWILLATKAWGFPDPDLQATLIIKIVIAAIPTVIAITFALWATVRYWGWIWDEIGGPRRKDA